MDRFARSGLNVAAPQSTFEFVACYNALANRMTIQILAVMAEHEG
jgi:hypothetical protein